MEDMDYGEIIPINMRREDDLLLRILKHFFSKDDSGQIKERLHSQLDWPYLLESASRQKVIPILYRSLESMSFENMPADALKELQTRFRDNTLHNFSMTSELGRLLDLFEGNSIHVIPFKGPVLSSLLYGEIALRQSVDLDLVIHREDLFKAVDIIKLQGYDAIHQMSKIQQESFLRKEHHIALFNKEKNLFLEVHWRISPEMFSMQTDMEGLWLGAEKRAILGRSMLCFASEDLFMILCDHGARHRWNRLVWVCDIAKLIEVEKFDWTHVFERAKKEGSTRSVLLALSLANIILGSSLTPEVQRKVQADPQIKSLSVWVIGNLFKDKCDPEREDLPGSLKDKLLYTYVMVSFKDRVRYFLIRATNPCVLDFDLIHLPDGLYPLYHLIRPLRVTGVYCLKIWKWLIQ